ncbi:MAG: biotin/lipoyl-containing protein [Planctomycetota bacterium]|jgi:pyruvate/2-oxoglutarate dehydrogenase complex dihydrolipoamide acyltransferase (E2) component
MHLIRVPSLAENVDQATIATWLIQDGDLVKKGTPIVELITEKAEFTLELEEDVEGFVLGRFAPEKSVIPVGFILVAIGGDEDLSRLAEVRQSNANLLQNQATAPTSSFDTAQLADLRQALKVNSGRVRATPVARRLAKEHNLDLQAVADTLKVEGAVKEEHIQAYLKDHTA